MEAIKGAVVMHTCDNRACINPAHLVLGTQLVNIADRVAKERCAKGTTHASVKLTEQQVLEIRKLSKTHSYASLSQIYGVTTASIGSIVNRVTWKHVP